MKTFPGCMLTMSHSSWRSLPSWVRPGRDGGGGICFFDNQKPKINLRNCKYDVLQVDPSAERQSVQGIYFLHHRLLKIKITEKSRFISFPGVVGWALWPRVSPQCVQEGAKGQWGCAQVDLGEGHWGLAGISLSPLCTCRATTIITIIWWTPIINDY